MINRLTEFVHLHGTAIGLKSVTLQTSRSTRSGSLLRAAQVRFFFHLSHQIVFWSLRRKFHTHILAAKKFLTISRGARGPDGRTDTRTGKLHRPQTGAAVPIRSFSVAVSRPALYRLAIVFSLVLAMALLFRWLFVPRLAKGITRSGLLALRQGMPEPEVVRLIGEPLFKERIFEPHPIGKKPRWEGDWSWSYGEQAFFDFGPGFEISVNFHNGHLAHAAAERFDLGIWWCNARGCPVVWNRDEFNKLPGP